MSKFLKKLSEAELALTFDDVLILPGPSDLEPDEIDTSVLLSPNLKLSIPIISSPMDTVTGRELLISLGKLGGLGILPRNMNTDEQLSIIKEAKELGVPCGVAVGPRDIERARRFIDAGADAIVIDSAHGHSKAVIESTKKLSKYDVVLIAGNIVTAEAALELVDAGATALRVGVGPGHSCTTREITGVGCPQLTAIAKVADAVLEKNVSVIADGGIEKSGDIVKAIAAGSDAVMLGYLLASASEAPGERKVVDGKCFKKYRGMGSKGALLSGSTRYGEFKKVPEGVEGFIPCKGTVKEIVEELVNGLKQGMGYVGARNIKELKEKAKFVKLSPYSHREGGPRGLFFFE